MNEKNLIEKPHLVVYQNSNKVSEHLISPELEKILKIVGYDSDKTYPMKELVSKLKKHQKSLPPDDELWYMKIKLQDINEMYVSRESIKIPIENEEKTKTPHLVVYKDEIPQFQQPIGPELKETLQRTGYLDNDYKIKKYDKVETLLTDLDSTFKELSLKDQGFYFRMKREDLKGMYVRIELIEGKK